MGARSPGWLDFFVRCDFLGVGLLSVVGLLRHGTSGCGGGASDGWECWGARVRLLSVGLLAASFMESGDSGGWDFVGVGILGARVRLLSVGLLAGGFGGGGAVETLGGLRDRESRCGEILGGRNSGCGGTFGVLGFSAFGLPSVRLPARLFAWTLACSLASSPAYSPACSPVCSSASLLACSLCRCLFGI